MDTHRLDEVQAERPKTEPMPALKNALRTYADAETLEKGFIARAIRDKKIHSRSQLDAIKDALDMQRDEEIEAIQGTSYTTENDPLVSIIDSELADIEKIFSIGNEINDRIRGDLDILNDNVKKMVTEDPLLVTKSEDDLRKIIVAKAKGLQLFQLSEDEEWALNLVDKREDSREKQEKYIEAEINSLIKEIKK
ncbi:MAG: hypothetical protein JWP09_870 [Candidatus Taylorbacteria bacterium]|nr:hypothetical protein [Candidatus Taylorbacteria bacterium]